MGIVRWGATRDHPRDGVSDEGWRPRRSAPSTRVVAVIGAAFFVAFCFIVLELLTGYAIHWCGWPAVMACDPHERVPVLFEAAAAGMATFAAIGFADLALLAAGHARSSGYALWYPAWALVGLSVLVAGGKAEFLRLTTGDLVTAAIITVLAAVLVAATLMRWWPRARLAVIGLGSGVVMALASVPVLAPGWFRDAYERPFVPTTASTVCGTGGALCAQPTQGPTQPHESPTPAG